MIWYIQDFLRSRDEREKIEELAARVDWLNPVRWRVDDSVRLCFDADIEASGRTYPVTLRYPNHFPHSPVIVLPRDTTERWSAHQFGAGGELCLEYGSDNWLATYTGADQLESAQRLLVGENPAPGERGTVATRHATTEGQRRRSEYWRLLVSNEVRAQLATLSDGEALKAQIITMVHREVMVECVSSLTLRSGEVWKDPRLPRHLTHENFALPGIFLRWQEGRDLPPLDKMSDLKTALLADGVDIGGVSYVALLVGNEIRPFWFNQEKDSLSAISVLDLPADEQRLGGDHDAMAGKKIGIVGCGSIGSKIAVMLARSGADRFLFVDDDIMLPGNLARHQLDWREMGTMKAASVARAVELVRPEAICEVRRDRVGGQESGGSLETLIGALAKCDLIIDATADPHVFNYLCAASLTGKKPLIWAEVFAGGVAGLVARHRPGIEPEPALMRRAIENWCAEQGKPRERHGGYDGRKDETPLIADDADVTVIAAHAARFAIDTLIGRQPSIFPDAVYLIGMAPGWITDLPFEVRPIGVGTAVVSEPIPIDPAIRDEEMARIGKLFTETVDEAAAPQDRS